jgi:2,4-dienoyl-CoA reductase-like NADH-dependent reductase (Old Yellow Enzyme family)/thioredoxin reductase
MAHFETLFTPFRIGKLVLKNRIVMPPMATNFAGPDGAVNDQHVSYYVKRARGGVGYITFEHTGIRPDGRAFPQMAMIDSDDKIVPFRRLVDGVHRAGGRIVIQINHAGRNTSSSTTGAPLVAPSAVACPVRKEMPRELSPAEIGELVAAFRQAARRVREAGADGVEVHMAHGYLLSQFLSPFSNRRADEYGGTRSRRMTAPLEVLRAVRGQVGPDFPVICRLSADEYVEGGLRLEDSMEIARALESNGADALHVSACVPASGYLNHPPYYADEGTFVHLAQGIKSAVSLPVITVGRIRTPDLANRIVEEGRADLVSMGRALIADPELPVKAREGRTGEIIPCISCNRCILSIRKGPLHCAVNPETGREGSLRVERTDRPKTVWVIGGGPAGMKAAEVAGRRGHRVTLFEKEEKLGGQFLLAAMPPRKQVLGELVDSLKRSLDRLPVEIRTGRLFDPALLDGEKPEAVIVATGGQPCLPPIEGVREAGVFSVDEVFFSPDRLGRKVLVVGGGGVGAEVADTLSELGKEVTLMEMREGIALDLVGHLQHFLNKRLAEKKVTVLTSTRAVRFEKGAVWAEGPQGRDRLGGFDAIVIAMGRIPYRPLAESLKGRVPEIFIVGDACAPREVMEALLEGEEAAIRI